MRTCWKLKEFLETDKCNNPESCDIHDIKKYSPHT